jgi:hypothetical protein
VSRLSICFMFPKSMEVGVAEITWAEAGAAPRAKPARIKRETAATCRMQKPAWIEFRGSMG